MRDYGKVSPRFWTGATGKQLRGLGPHELVIALYLVTCPTANMIGLYYLPLPTLSHETGIDSEGASKALRRVQEVGFALYDAPSEFVFVPNMARFQIGERLTRADNRHKAVMRELEALRECCFFEAFVERYRVQFELDGIEKRPPAASPSEAPSEPLRSQKQEQEQEKKQEQEQQTPALPLVARPATKRQVAADIRKAIFDEGLELLRKGRSERQARALLGKLCSEHTDERVLHAIRDAHRERPVDAIAWMRKTLKAKGANGRKGGIEPGDYGDVPT